MPVEDRVAVGDGTDAGDIHRPIATRGLKHLRANRVSDGEPECQRRRSFSPAGELCMCGSHENCRVDTPWV